MSKGQGGSGRWCNKVNHIKRSSFAPIASKAIDAFFSCPCFAAVMASKDLRDSEKPIAARWLSAGEDERKWKWLSLKAALPRAALWFTKPFFHSEMACWLFLSQEMTWLWVLNGTSTCSALRVGRIQELRSLVTSLIAPLPLCLRQRFHEKPPPARLHKSALSPGRCQRASRPTGRDFINWIVSDRRR